MLSGIEVPPTLMIEFRIPQYAVSDLKISQLDLYGEVRESLQKSTTMVQSPATSYSTSSLGRPLFGFSILFT